ncbi:Squalene/phytoene synthase [Trinorchestia longiramus]|nr:Squalene/phytoene synthase [Trinorchestia longiramus]
MLLLVPNFCGLRHVRGILCRSFSSKSSDGSQYCLNSVRQHDYENFLAALLLPEACRTDIFAIRAFNIELAQVGVTTTREPIAGMMRLEFWRDILNNLYGDQPAPAQPVARQLHRAVKTHRLSKRWLRQLIDSRDDLLQKPGFNSIAELEAYAEASNSALYYLTLQAAGVSNIDADHCASHVGKGEGILRLLRGVPFLASKRQVLLPRQLLATHGVSEEEVLRGCREQKFKDIVFDLATASHQHVEHARELSKKLPRAARTALLPLVSTSSTLERLRRADFDIYDSRLSTRDSLLPIKLWWAKTRQRL